MNENFKNDPLSSMLCGLEKELQGIYRGHSKYYKDIQNGANIGFFSDGDDKKELARAYYEYASLLATSVSNMEALLAELPSVIIEADRNDRKDRILLCDELITSYGEFKSSISMFATQNERILAKDSTSRSEMIRLQSELGYKLSFFECFLKEHQS